VENSARIFGPPDQIRFEQETTPIEHPPVVEFSFKYENAIIACAQCGSKCTLGNAEDGDSNDLSRLCPICHRMLDIQFETIEEAFKRSE
jgi:hypothetical protein